MTSLPPLRSGIRVLRGPLDWDGSVTATLHDPLRGRFFRIGRRERALVAHWHLGEAAKVAEAASAELGEGMEPADALQLAGFLARNELLVGEAAPRPEAGLLSKALHSYLFFRIPLFSPERFVAAAQPALDRLLAARWFPLALAVLAGWGIVQTLRQWDVFIATLPPLANAGGQAIYGAVLVVSALVHELGHAYAARRAGCRVGSVGIAVMVMVPTLYTEMDDAWALPERRQRVVIGLAGIAAELALALVALVLWPLLPQGAAQSALVALATTALVTTLAINLNPLMRFDGYYLLSDLFELPNLQSRAFALWRWRLRRLLFGIDVAAPETPPPAVAWLLSVWAWIAVPWRAVLYFGIALLVYHAVFKLAGIALFAVEAGWFLILPCWREAHAWWQLRRLMNRRRLAVSGAVAAAALVGLAVPWGGSVEMGAVMEAERHARLYAPQPARLVDKRVVEGARVAEGEVLLAFDAPELNLRIRDNALRLELARWQVDHLLAQDDLDRLSVERQALAGIEAEQAGLVEQAARLQVRAPFAGEVVEVNPTLNPGLWLDTTQPVVALVDSSSCRVLAYAEEGELGRLVPGSAARFYPDDPGQPVTALVLREIDESAAAKLDDPLFHADYGGTIAMRHVGNRPVPATSVFRLRLDAVARSHCRTRLRGHVVAEAARESIAMAVWRRAAGILRAESGL